MKKLFVCLMAVCLGISINVSAQSAYAKQKAKQTKKEYKQKVKEFQKGGWEIFGSSHTLEMALLEHFEALEKDGVTELTSMANSTNKNIGKEKLMMSACAKYANQMGSNVKGRIVSDMGSVQEDEIQDIESFYAAYENNVKAEIRGELRPSFAVYRKTKIGSKDAFEFQGFYLIDEEGASKARIRAFQNAAKESEVARKNAELISKFINEASYEDE